MNAAQFLEIITKSGTPERDDFLSLKKIQENFPYFQIPHVLTAKYEFLKNPEKRSESLGFAAITSPDRIWLKKLIHKKSDAGSLINSLEKEDLLKEEVDKKIKANLKTDSKVDFKDVEIKEESTLEEKPKPVRKRRKPPKDDLIESIKLKQKREILDSKKKEQNDLIKAFSKKSIKLATIKEIEANQNTENLAANSVKINDNLISESLAKLLVTQGKKTMAQEIYEKLMLKFPDKRSYFADLIEKLKE